MTDGAINELNAVTIILEGERRALGTLALKRVRELVSTLLIETTRGKVGSAPHTRGGINDVRRTTFRDGVSDARARVAVDNLH
jgi:hypothetical protein